MKEDTIVYWNNRGEPLAVVSFEDTMDLEKVEEHLYPAMIDVFGVDERGYCIVDNSSYEYIDEWYQADGKVGKDVWSLKRQPVEEQLRGEMIIGNKTIAVYMGMHATMIEARVYLQYKGLYHLAEDLPFYRDYNVLMGIVEKIEGLVSGRAAGNTKTYAVNISHGVCSITEASVGMDTASVGMDTQNGYAVRYGEYGNTRLAIYRAMVDFCQKQLDEENSRH